MTLDLHAQPIPPSDEKKAFSNSPVAAGYFYFEEQSIFKKKYLQTRGQLVFTTFITF